MTDLWKQSYSVKSLCSHYKLCKSAFQRIAFKWKCVNKALWSAMIIIFMQQLACISLCIALTFYGQYIGRCNVMFVHWHFPLVWGNKALPTFLTDGLWQPSASYVDNSKMDIHVFSVIDICMCIHLFCRTVYGYTSNFSCGQQL